jgi:hypothetical protein
MSPSLLLSWASTVSCWHQQLTRSAWVSQPTLKRDVVLNLLPSSRSGRGSTTFRWTETNILPRRCLLVEHGVSLAAPSVDNAPTPSLPPALLTWMDSAESGLLCNSSRRCGSTDVSPASSRRRPTLSSASTRPWTIRVLSVTPDDKCITEQLNKRGGSWKDRLSGCRSLPWQSLVSRD